MIKNKGKNMIKKRRLISDKRIHRLKVQGYSGHSGVELSALAFGNRFAYVTCLTFLIIGVASANLPILIAMSIIAFGGIILPFHPFDYIYNYVLRRMLNKPKLPSRSKQLKFACTLATLWIIATAYLFYAGLTIAGYVLGSLLISVAFLVSTTDFCIPSMIYNLIFKIKV